MSDTLAPDCGRELLELFELQVDDLSSYRHQLDGALSAVRSGLRHIKSAMETDPEHRLSDSRQQVVHMRKVLSQSASVHADEGEYLSRRESELGDQLGHVTAAWLQVSFLFVKGEFIIHSGLNLYLMVSFTKEEASP